MVDNVADSDLNHIKQYFRKHQPGSRHRYLIGRKEIFNLEFYSPVSLI